MAERLYRAVPEQLQNAMDPRRPRRYWTSRPVGSLQWQAFRGSRPRMEPKLIAPVQKRLTISFADSTSFKGTDSVSLKSINPRNSQARVVSSLTCSANRQYASLSLVWAACCRLKSTLDPTYVVHRLLANKTHLNCLRHSSVLDRPGYPSSNRLSASSAKTSRLPPSMRLAVPTKH